MIEKLELLIAEHGDKDVVAFAPNKVTGHPQEQGSTFPVDEVSDEVLQIEAGTTFEINVMIAQCGFVKQPAPAVIKTVIKRKA